MAIRVQFNGLKINNVVNFHLKCIPKSKTYFNWLERMQSKSIPGCFACISKFSLYLGLQKGSWYHRDECFN